MATKKTIKKEAPIDRRETFVSIQKTFAEPDKVQEKLGTLWDLQQSDIKIDKIHQLRGELPVEVADLEKEIAELRAYIKAEEHRAKTILASLNSAKGILSDIECGRITKVVLPKTKY